MALKNQAGLIKIIDAIECMEKSLSCAICLEISSEPVETRCGHLFCRNCIQKVLSHPGDSCPVCKFNLTRRSVSSSSHMGLCIQQLSKLIDAVRSDTDIDITSCLKTHYKKRAFLPSASSSSPQSQQEIQNQIPPLESYNNTKKNPQNYEDLAKPDIRSASKESSVEYPFHKPRDQTTNNLSCKIITKKSQLETKTWRLTAANPLRVQNENILPPENTGAPNKPKSATETHQFDPNVNEDTDTSLEENRQCLKDISTINLNRSVTDQSTKTWSRVAKFGKELRRKTGRNSPRIHKKPKLSVNVRDKSVLLNSSHDHSIEKSGEDRVDHDSDTNNSILKRHEDDVNISVSEMKKTVGENVNPARLKQNDKIILKNKKQETLTTLNSKTCNENAAFDTNEFETDERLPNSGSGISEDQINRGAKKMTKQIQKRSDVLLLSDCVKTVIPVNNSDKQSSEEKGKASEASSAVNSGKSLFSANKGRKQSSEEKEKVSEDSSAADSGKSLFSANKGRKQSSEETEKVSEASSAVNSGKSLFSANKGRKQSSEEKEKVSEASSAVNSGKSLFSANKGRKQSSEEKEKVSEASSAVNSGNSLFSANKGRKQSSEEKEQVSEDSSAVNYGKSLFSANKGRNQSSEEKEKVSEASSAADFGKSLFSGNKKSNQSSEEKERVLEATSKANSAKLVSPENKNSKRIHSDDSSTTNLEKIVDTANKGSKRLSEERGKLPESLNTFAEKEAETARAVRKNINHAADGESHTRRIKRTKYPNVVENVVSFKKLGHLVRQQRKSVPFLYLASTKPKVSEIFSESASICKLCSSCQLSDKSTLLQKQRLESSGPLSRAVSFESVSFNSRKLLPLPQLSTSRINKNDRRENHFQIPSVPKEQNIPPKNDLQSRFLSKDDTETKTLPDENESSIIGRKRKRSESSDRVDDQCTEERNEKRVSKKRSEPLDHEDQYTEEQSENRLSKKRSEPLDHEVQYTEEQSEKRLFKKRSEPLDHEVEYTEEESEKRVSKKRFEPLDHEVQYREEENEKRVSEKRSEPLDHEVQYTEEQNEKRVSKKRSEPLDHEVQYTEEQNEKRVSKKRSEPLDHEVQYTEEESEKRVSKKQSKSPDREDQSTEKQSKECVSRKRSETSDQSTKNQSRTHASHELTQMENDKYFGVDSLLIVTLHSQALADKSPQTEQLPVQEKDTTDVTNSPEHESVNVEPVEMDCRIKNAFQEANITLRGNGVRRLPQPMPITTSNAPKNVNCTESRDLIGPKDCERSRTYLDVIGKNSDVHEYEEGSEINLSRASMMDITAEELLFKKFEENLFGPVETGNIQKRSENNKVLKENTTDALAVANPTLISEPLDQSVSVPKTALMGHNQSLEMEDFVELTPTEQNLNRLNNPPEIIRNKESAAIQPNTEKAQNCEEEKAAETRVRGSQQNEEAKMHTPAQSVTKMRPIYQSTPKSSQVSTDRYRLTVYRQMNEKANSPIGFRGCILCSGLTSKQSEEVKYLSGLFNMQYTKKFTEDVTHIIVKTTGENNGACKTLKYLQGVAYRKWIVNFNWIVDSVAQKKLLSEESYEVVDSTTLIAGPKKARSGEKRPFDGFVFYCVEPFQNISVPDYEDLLRQMGATVVGSLKDLAAEESIFKIIALQADCHEKKIIEWHQITKAVPVAQEWIVECISQYRLVSLLPFLQELVPQDILDLGFPEELIQDDDSDFMYDMST